MNAHLLPERILFGAAFYDEYRVNGDLERDLRGTPIVLEPWDVTVLVEQRDPESESGERSCGPST